MSRARATRLARELLGAPVVPPGPATAALQRVRTALGWSRRRLAPPPVVVLEALLGVADNRVLGVLVDLDVPAHLDRPRTADDVAARSGADPEAMARVLRFAAARGFVGHRRGRYRANGVTRALRDGHAGSWRGWAEFASSGWYWDAWRHLDDVVRGRSPSGLDAATGRGFFDYVHRVDPDAGRVFDRAMAAGGRFHGLALATGLRWPASGSVCDVGGGTGALLGALLTVEEGWSGTVVDLPEVVARAEHHDRLRTQAGDFFESVPAGHDRYLLVAVVHDWDDEAASRILTNVAAAMGPDARAVVVENVLPDRPSDTFAVLTDIQMMALSPGRERTAAEYERLFTAAGLALVSRIVLATGATAMVLAPT